MPLQEVQTKISYEPLGLHLNYQCFSMCLPGGTCTGQRYTVVNSHLQLITSLGERELLITMPFDSIKCPFVVLFYTA